MTFKVVDPETGKVLEFADSSGATAYFNQQAVQNPTSSYSSVVGGTPDTVLASRAVAPISTTTVPTTVRPTTSTPVRTPILSSYVNDSGASVVSTADGKTVATTPSGMTYNLVNNQWVVERVSQPTKLDASGSVVAATSQTSTTTPKYRSFTAAEAASIRAQQKYYTSRGLPIPKEIDVLPTTAEIVARMAKDKQEKQLAAAAAKPIEASPELANKTYSAALRDSSGNQIGSVLITNDSTGRPVTRQETNWKTGEVTVKDVATGTVIASAASSKSTSGVSKVPITYMNGKERVTGYVDVVKPTTTGGMVRPQITVEQAGASTRLKLSDNEILHMNKGGELYLNIDSSGNISFLTEKGSGTNYKLNNSNIDWYSTAIDFGNDNSITLHTPNGQVVLANPYEGLSSDYYKKNAGILRNALVDVDWAEYDKQDALREQQLVSQIEQQKQQKQQQAQQLTNAQVAAKYNAYLTSQTNKENLLKLTGNPSYKPAEGTESFIYGTSTGKTSPKWGNITASGDVIMTDMWGNERAGSLYVTDKKAYFLVDSRGQVPISGSMDAGIPNFTLVTNPTTAAKTNLLGVPYAYKGSATLASFLTGSGASARKQKYNGRVNNRKSTPAPVKNQRSSIWDISVKPSTKSTKVGSHLKLGESRSFGESSSFGEPIKFEKFSSVSKPMKIKPMRVDKSLSFSGMFNLDFDPVKYKRNVNKKKKKTQPKKKFPRLLSFLESR
jgi:hypothetical protein